MTEKVNILFLVHGFGIGGVQKLNVQMINGINKDKFAVHVLYINEGLLMDDLDINKVKLLKLGDKLKRESVSTLKYILRVTRYVKSNKIDVIHTIDSTLYMVGSIVARFSKIKHVRTQPNFIRRHERLNTKTLKLLPFEKWTDKFITYNLASNKDLQLAGVSSDKIETIYGFAKHEDYLLLNNLTDIKEEFCIPKNNKIILAMHRMVPRKGYETFVEMIPYIIKEYKEVTFLLVGDGPLRKELETKVRELNIEDYVVFTGFRKDIVNIAKQINFGVYPLADTAAMVTVLRVGKVLITRRNSSMDEYINDGVTGYLTPDDNPKTYAQYALKLLTDNNLLRKMEERQKDYIVSIFDGNKNMEKFEEILISVNEQGKNSNA
jgi:glycosyltransferase involved in cell wall biosynthesis